MGISLSGLNSGLADTYSTLLGGSSSNNSDATSLLADYASIKNGSYGKMMKSYYSKITREDTDESASSKASKNVKDSLSSVSAGTAYKSAEKLSGMTISEDNIEDVRDAIKTFVDDYNSLMKNASKSDNSSVQKQANSLNDTMYTNYKLFAKVGITLNSDRTLSINEETLKNADIGTLKTLFSGSGSFADKVSYKASQIYRSASEGQSVTAKTYTNNGAYSSTNTADSTIDSTT